LNSQDEDEEADVSKELAGVELHDKDEIEEDEGNSKKRKVR
jgi:hypothetical protein